MSDATQKDFNLKKMLPIIVIGITAILGFIFLREHMTLDTLRENRERLVDWRDANYALAVMVYMAIYIAVVAFSLPGALPMTLTGGFLFGFIPGTIITVLSATIGAVLIFFAAKTGLGDTLRERAGPFMKKLEKECQDNEISFMFLLRLVPVVPFFIANLAPAFLGVRPLTYIWTTLFGIIPGTAVFSSVGSGLSEVFARGEDPDLSVFWEPHIIGPILGLIALACLPIIVKKMRRTPVDA